MWWQTQISLPPVFLFREADAKMRLDVQEIYWGKYQQEKELQEVRRAFGPWQRWDPYEGERKEGGLVGSATDYGVVLKHVSEANGSPWGKVTHPSGVDLLICATLHCWLGAAPGKCFPEQRCKWPSHSSSCQMTGFIIPWSMTIVSLISKATVIGHYASVTKFRGILLVNLNFTLFQSAWLLVTMI